MSEPYEWEEAQWRGMVEQVRAGRSLLPERWPGGARCAVALSFDSDHETNELRDGGTSIARLGWGEYGTRRGIPRIKKVLDRFDVKASFFVPAVAALLHPEEQRMLAQEGHEIGLHGWIHERNTLVPPDAERDLMLRSADTLEQITGTRPVGMRTPSWDYSAVTLKIAREMGLLYDSSLFNDDDPFEILDDGEPTGIVELPVEWIRDDAVYFMMNRFGPHRPYTPPTDVLDIFRREFDGAYAEGGLFLLTMHPHVTGYRSRIFILEQLLEHITAKGDCWIAPHAEIARYCAEQAGLKGTS
ncbi:polysaccharide deacetylase family protein [Alloyangia pacifica]|uniref:polysaccharide deacetylase family protein n=1 Tax=Alloyangia pacifica TaxID=311180 RepID=UPI001CD67048|nr:polysaccharide deacetylase [Alloyangia pacifica]MCA0998169.1 polysaccharide deacetylase [Alloyangia pacifica]